MTLTNTPPRKTDSPPGRRTPLSAVSPALRWALFAGLGLALIFGVTQFTVIFSPYGLLPALIGGGIFLTAGFVLSVLVTLLLAALRRLRWQTSLVFFLALLICVTTMYLEVYLLPLFAFAMATVYLTVMGATGRYRTHGILKRILRYGLSGLSGALSVAILILILWPGPSLNTRTDRARLALPHADRIQNGASALDNPSAPGSFSYTVHYYAVSGQKKDPYPGQQTLSSRTVDASELLEGWSGIRASQLGFGPDALPLNAQVWMPTGTGPFPLTLIVHGNHESGSRSDGGYAYLGELLASRGIIAVSADENFLNSSVLYDLLFLAGLKEENGARAFVLLEHLRQWHDWNSDTSNPFYGKVDFDNIALIGHSRGGEAAALAAVFAELNVYPDNGLVTLAYPFRIRSVVAVAPVHGQYEPAGLEAALENVNYLVLHGGHDMDVFSFQGANMFHRTDVSGSGIRAQIWMQYASHGQFNSQWGASDMPGLANLVFRRGTLMPMDQQQQAAKVFISAFLESSLHGREEYNALFRDFAQGGDWLPPALYITDYADSQTILLDSFDGSYDLNMSSSGQVACSAQGFDIWTQNTLPGKGPNSNRVLTLSWGSEKYAEKYGRQTPVFTTEFAEGTVSAGDKIYVSLCSGRKNLNEPDISFRIRLTDSVGNVSTMSVNDFGGVVNPIDAPISKPPISLMTGRREPVLQMICIPTKRFDSLNGDIVRMEWVMDTGETGKNGQILYVDDLRVERQR